MNASRPTGGASEVDSGSWANESVPLSVRKELLERELNKLGFRMNPAHGDSVAAARASKQAGKSGSSHPKADASDGAGHGD